MTLKEALIAQTITTIPWLLFIGIMAIKVSPWALILVAFMPFVNIRYFKDKKDETST